MTTEISPRRSAYGGTSPFSTPAVSHANAGLSCILRARDGDQAALDQMWRQFHAPLLGFFLRRVSCREEAEDLASDTFFAALSGLNSFRGADNKTGAATFRSYLYGIAHNKLKHWIRRKADRPCDSLQDVALGGDEAGRDWEEKLPAGQGDPEQDILRQAHLEDVCFALGQTGLRSPDQFKALLFAHVCEWPHKEVAALFGTRHETVNTRLQEGREKVREHYARAC